jgi:GntR family transcriptional regulator
VALREPPGLVVVRREVPWNGSNDTRISGIMLSRGVDPSDPLPLHEQVAAEIRRAIADGEVSSGDRLPPARDLAAVLGVNHNTVIRALHSLRDEGLLEFRRGRGITVTGEAPERSVLIARVRETVALARRQGYGRDELVAIIEAL